MKESEEKAIKQAIHDKLLEIRDRLHGVSDVPISPDNFSFDDTLEGSAWWDRVIKGDYTMFLSRYEKGFVPFKMSEICLLEISDTPDFIRIKHGILFTTRDTNLSGYGCSFAYHFSWITDVFDLIPTPANFDVWRYARPRFGDPLAVQDMNDIIAKYESKTCMSVFDVLPLDLQDMLLHYADKQNVPHNVWTLRQNIAEDLSCDSGVDLDKTEEGRDWWYSEIKPYVEMYDRLAKSQSLKSFAFAVMSLGGQGCVDEGLLGVFTSEKVAKQFAIDNNGYVKPLVLDKPIHN